MDLNNILVEVQYKNYTENVVINNGQDEKQLRQHLKYDQDVVGYLTLQGDFNDLEIEVKNINRKREVYVHSFGRDITTYKSCDVIITKGNHTFGIHIPLKRTEACNHEIDRIKVTAHQNYDELFKKYNTFPY